LSHEPHGAGPPGAGPAPETAAEAPSEPEFPEDSDAPGRPAPEGDDPPATDKPE